MLDTTLPTSVEESIYYFGVGPIVNPAVRKRHGVHVTEETAAVLPDFRLTFVYGGIANVVEQRGYDVHGIVMKFTSLQSWKSFVRTNVGNNLSKLVKVYPYNEEAFIEAYVFHMKPEEFDCDKLDLPIEQLPAERYLRLIANGMRSYQIDDEYIQDQIMNIPFVPTRTPDQYIKFPTLKEPKKITFRKYRRLCRKALKRRSSKLYFILGEFVFEMPFSSSQTTNTGVLWVLEHAHGKPDATLMLHRLLIDPDIPVVDSQEALTPLHVAWAENHSVEFLQKCGLSAKRIYQLDDRAVDSGMWCCFT